MALDAATLDKLRRMVSEPLASTYTDEMLTAYVEEYPVPDSNGHFPTNSEWVATYDLNSAAADIWDEKASAISDKFDFSTDGGSFSRNQAYQNAVNRSRYFRARRNPTVATLRKSPRELSRVARDYPWIANLPEPED